MTNIIYRHIERIFGRVESSKARGTRKQEIFGGTTKTKSESEVKKIDRPKIQDSEAKYLFSGFFR
ncbi:MAG: hypothetical protein ACI4B8_07555 [Candidatus Gastranaerophilaceae bacterium]